MLGNGLTALIGGVQGYKSPAIYTNEVAAALRNRSCQESRDTAHALLTRNNCTVPIEREHTRKLVIQTTGVDAGGLENVCTFQSICKCRKRDCGHDILGVVGACESDDVD